MARFLLLESNVGKVRYSNGTGELWYSSCVARELAKQIKELGHEVIEVVAPSPEAANAAIHSYKPDVVWFVGHGLEDRTSLELAKLWIKAPDYNVDVVRGTVVCAESCLTGAYLGKYVVSNGGASAYLGFTKEVMFIWCGEKVPCQCSGENPWGVRPEVWQVIVKAPHDAIFHFVIGLAKGLSLKQAYELAYNRFNYWIDYLSKIRYASDAEAAIARVAIWSLAWDANAMVLYARDASSSVVRVQAPAVQPQAVAAPSPSIARPVAVGATVGLFALPVTGDARAALILGGLATLSSFLLGLRGRGKPA